GLLSAVARLENAAGDHEEAVKDFREVAVLATALVALVNCRLPTSQGLPRGRRPGDGRQERPGRGPPQRLPGCAGEGREEQEEGGLGGRPQGTHQGGEP